MLDDLYNMVLKSFTNIFLLGKSCLEHLSLKNNMYSEECKNHINHKIYTPV